MKARDVMSQPVITVTPETSVKEAARLLVEKAISGLPVVDEHDRLCGILTEADLVPLEGRPDPRSSVLPIDGGERAPRTVAEVMTKDVITAGEDVEVAQLAQLMLKSRLKRVPIVRGDQVVGIVSRRDLLKVLARSDQDIQAELEKLIRDQGLLEAGATVRVEGGVAILPGGEPRVRELLKILAEEVPGVLEVRFAEPGAG